MKAVSEPLANTCFWNNAGENVNAQAGPPAVQSDCRPTTTPGGPLEHHSFYSYFLFLFFIFISVFSLNLFKY